MLLVLVADSQLELGISGYGLALAVTGVSAFVGSVAAPVCARRWRPVALLPLAFLPPAAAVYVGGLAPNLAVLVAGLGVTAASFQLLKVLVDAVVGGASPDAVRGRVFSVYDVLYNVAFVLAGLLMVPLWDPDEVTTLLWWVAAAFLLAWLLFARVFRAWPFTSRPSDALPSDARPSAVRPARRWRWRTAALACGALPLLAFPAVQWWWFAWVSLVPAILLLRAAPTSREAAVRGWWVGAGYIAAANHWLWPVTGPALVLAAFLVGFLWLPWGWAVRRMLSGRPSSRTLLAATLVLPSGWAAIEAIRSWQSLGGPWAMLGASQWNQPEMLASAALGGVWLTSFLIVAVNVALAAALTTARRGALVALVSVAAAALAVGPVWAAARPSPTHDGVVRVAAVQPGVLGDAEVRLDRGIRLSDSVAGEHPDLVVWGESSVGFDLRSEPEVLARLVGVARRTGAPVLVNVDARAPNGTIYKTSTLVTEDGMDGSYVKTRLVPFGEYIPGRRLLGWITGFSEAAEVDRGRGSGPAVLDAGRLTFGPLICFESAFSDMARREVQLGAELIVYQTSNSTFQGSWAQPQHASLAAVRAVETGRPTIHVALTGTSAAFDATGRQLMWIGPGEQGAETLTLTLTSGRTPYDVAGEWVLAVAAVVIAAALIGASLRSTGRPEEVEPTDLHEEHPPPEREPASVAD